MRVELPRVADRVLAHAVPAFGPEALGSLPLMEQALARALVAMDPVPLSVVHGIVSDDWLAADQPHFDVCFPQLTFSV